MGFIFCCVLAACGGDEAPRQIEAELPAPSFVGSEACAACHAAETDAWSGSHHDLAMRLATDETVLGDFDDATFTYFDIESRFYRDGDRYLVTTDNEVGEPTEYEIEYTFGVYPLQQYLVEFPQGRLQPLALTWDSRPAAEGGQRWFHLYPDEFIAHDDLLHWTGADQNWNFMCAECHSTELIKNFDRGSRSFDTQWSEINVGCEGCHGPASRHVTLAEADSLQGNGGLVVDLDDAGATVWRMDVVTGIAVRSEARMRPPMQPEACGRCHSRRSQVSDGYEYGHALADTHIPSLLDDGLYYADGQIREEVYVWGSFMQSRMYQAGVSCTDCHDPHSATLKSGAAPSDICATCHLPARFAQHSHHQHEAGQVECVDCHMPSRDYMVIDGRRDHSFRVPRPDLTIATGAPNACNGCHESQGVEWADAILRNWYGADRPAHYATALHAGRTGAVDANRLLAAAAADPDFPGIARGTALSLLAWPLDSGSAAAIREGLASGDALIRLGALRALNSAPGEARLEWALPLLDDPIKAVRLEAVGVLLPLRGNIPGSRMASYALAENEYFETQLANAERPEAYSNLGSLFQVRGDVQRAERAFQVALEIQPRWVPARVNLADLYRAVSRDEDARIVLEEGLGLDPDAAALRHSLGLLLVRQQEIEVALVELRRAAELETANSRYAYVYGVALNSTGRVDDAIAVLIDARTRFPADFDIGWALLTTQRDAGRSGEAAELARELRAQFPDNPDVASMLQSITEGAP